MLKNKIVFIPGSYSYFYISANVFIIPSKYFVGIQSLNLWIKTNYISSKFLVGNQFSCINMLPHSY